MSSYLGRYGAWCPRCGRSIVWAGSVSEGTRAYERVGDGDVEIPDDSGRPLTVPPGEGNYRLHECRL